MTQKISGKPPTMKGGELAKRAEKREAAAQELKEAEEKGDQENIEKFQKRFVSLKCTVQLKILNS